MNLLNILLQAAPDSAEVSKIEGVTGKVGAAVDSIVANPENLSVQNIASTVGGIDWGNLFTTFISSISNFGFRLIAAILVFYVGRFLINKAHKMLGSVMSKKDVDASLSSFLLSLLRITLLFLLIITVIAILGIETSSFIAIFASAGVAIGLALSGTLQNFAGGVLILFLKPYKVGDFIDAGGKVGTVQEIQIFSTIIATPNNERIIIPNGTLSTSIINNYSSEKYRRLEWRVGISYGDDVARAREVILQLLNDDPLSVVDDAHQPSVNLESLDDSAVTLVVRGFCENADYWTVFYNIYEQIYTQLPKHGLNFPYPHMDVHMTQG